jgi:hypothetical protein
MPAITQAAKDYDAALQQMASNKAIKSDLELQKLQFDLAKARKDQEMSSPIGRSTIAADIAATLEQDKQRQFGTPIQEGMAQRMTSAGGPSILDATRMQAELDVSAKAGEAKRAALMNFAAGEKSLLPTANIDVGGVKQTVLAPQIGKTTADINEQIFQAQVPQLTKAYMVQGYDPDTAVKMAGSDVTKNLFKAQSSGKVVLTSSDGMSTISYTNEQAQKMWSDPSTPKFIKTQLNNFFGESEQPQAASWIKSRLGR